MPKIVKRTDETAKQIETLSGLGLTHEQICSVIGISKPTLYKYYEAEVSSGKAKAIAKVSENLYRIATGSGRGNITACIFFLKTQAKWKETEVREINVSTDENDRFKDIIETLRESKLSKKGGNESLN
jgi:transcriptional regulator with XRE-family HTH domain